MTMTSLVWNKITELAAQIESKFDNTGSRVIGHEKEYDWYNAIYTSNQYRRAHIEIVDHRANYKIYILHSTVFPHFNDPSPIWGFDVICGPNKITGAFHDFSWAGDNSHTMHKWFNKTVGNLTWNKPRQLPQWAQAIFSPSMIAAGNLQDESEIDQLCNIALTTLDYYLANVGLSQESGSDYHMAQNRYCHYQKQNPQVIQSMMAMGIEKSVIERFVNEVLFPEID
jgi:hypothetical protein